MNIEKTINISSSTDWISELNRGIFYFTSYGIKPKILCNPNFGKFCEDNLLNLPWFKNVGQVDIPQDTGIIGKFEGYEIECKENIQDGIIVLTGSCSMSRYEVIEILKKEKECVERQGTRACPNRDCANCDLLLPTDDVIEAYEIAIKDLKEAEEG